jgi:NadR type nicotinamide-nucleotide adenylyltransferase
MKRLCLLGPESTGKTRLAESIADHFGGEVMPEYGRYYDIFHKQGEDGAAKGENWTEEDLVKLAETHVAMREAMAAEAGALLVEDTDIIQTTIWAEYLLGKRSEALENMLRMADFADHYFILSPDVDWIDDGVRYAGDKDVRAWFFSEALAWLNKFKLGYHVIKGARWDERTMTAIKHAETRFGAPLR